jgi:hypothetical protein
MIFVLLELGFVFVLYALLKQCWTEMKYVVGTYVVFVFVFLFFVFVFAPVFAFTFALDAEQYSSE